MKVSYNLLKTYFDAEIPSPEKCAELFTFHSFEVDAIETITADLRGMDADNAEKRVKDTVFDLKVLPDRAHYCLCHKGVAGELSAITGIPLKKYEYKKLKTFEIEELSVKIEDEKLCRRYVGRRIENVKIGPSPKWLKDYIEVWGGRSINNIVDATNFTMMDVGQPLHAFDADKVKGEISVRLAKKDEKITTLDGKNLVLDEKCLIIADGEGPLAIAGIKGGNRAEVNENTKNIILESANFDPTETRKTARRVNILTDASKRFENEISPELAEEAMIKLTELVCDIGGDDMKIGEMVDIYPTKSPKNYIEISAKEISEILGVEIKEKEVVEILERMDIKMEKKKDILRLEIPYRRLDLKIPEDIAEEVGRIYGYEKIIEQTPTNVGLVRKQISNKKFEAETAVRKILAGQNFSEIFGYTFSDRGESEVANPLASDKGFLRTDLTREMKEKLQFNLQYTLFDKEPVRLFEIGSIFNKNGEFRHCSVGVAYKTKKINKSKEEIGSVLSKLLMEFGIAQNAENFPELVDGKFSADDTSVIFEFDFKKFVELIKKIPADISSDKFFAEKTKYQKISPYPRIIRDIAFFCPPNTASEYVAEIIKKSANTDLMTIGPVLFDQFSKDDKKSLAFRMIFQSQEKTLLDQEVNKIMEKIYDAIKSIGWEVR